jgi:hypothetical protein
MDRAEQDFLKGFEKAARLTREVRDSQPGTATDYLEAVAHLLADSQDLVCRGLAVGCLAAVGKP